MRVASWTYCKSSSLLGSRERNLEGTCHLCPRLSLDDWECPLLQNTLVYSSGDFPGAWGH